MGPPEGVPAGAEEGPLSAEEVGRYKRDGFVLLRRAFDPEVAEACR
jgi:hypothetical protein